LSKAFGATGGSISVFSKDTAEFISRFANPYIFGGPLSLSGVAAIVESCKIHLSDEIYERQQKLYSNINFFDSQYLPYEIVNNKQLIPIRGIKINDEDKAIKLGKYLLEKGYVLTCATYPTVDLGKAMLRLAISSLHTEKQILGLINYINKFYNAQ
jgi:7-keto-8-aminopelargonate synthetase-like enzyme